MDRERAMIVQALGVRQAFVLAASAPDCEFAVSTFEIPAGISAPA